MASAVEAVVSAAKVCPAANPVIADLRATRLSYRPEFTVMARLARHRSAMMLAIEAGWNFPPDGQKITYRATRLAELPDSPTSLFAGQGRQAFAADNQPPLTEASCCWPAPDSCRSQHRWHQPIFVATRDWQSIGSRHAQSESRLL